MLDLNSPDTQRLYDIEETQPNTTAMTTNHHYHFDITMTCSGCSGAVDRVLKKIEGLSSYHVNLEAQTADVYTDIVPFRTVLEKIKKTGKEVKGAMDDGVGVPLDG